MTPIPPHDTNWWLLDNRYGGCHRVRATSTEHARTEVRNNLAEAFTATGLTPSAAMRAAHSYHIRVVAGPARYDEIVAAFDAWNREDYQPAADLARRTGRPAIATQITSPRSEGTTPA